MKKIFAIALALVMVLSMASAFALNACSTPNFSWDKCYTETDYCGKGTVEVIPYVKTTIACEPYWKWVPNECAAVMPSESVWYAIRLTVDANPDEAWWDAAELKFELDGLYDDVIKDERVIKDLVERGLTMGDDEAAVYYLVFDAEDTKLVFIEEEDFEDADGVAVQDYLFSNVAKDVDVEVCVTLQSENDGVGIYNWGDFWVNSSALTFDEDGKADGSFRLQKEGEGVVVYTVVDGEVTKVEGDKDDVEEMNSVFNLGCGWVCVLDESVQANFGWDDEIKDCNPWNDVQSSIVDAECVVAIPKTGDASVLAWLF